jgi:hypothetical protein
MLFKETNTALFIVKTIGNTQIHSVGRRQGFSVLNQVIPIVTTGFKGLRVRIDFIEASSNCICQFHSYKEMIAHFFFSVLQNFNASSFQI